MKEAWKELLSVYVQPHATNVDREQDFVQCQTKNIIITMNFDALSVCNSSSLCFQFVFAVIKHARSEEQIGNVEC